MVLKMREFDFAHELAMYAGTGALLLLVIVVAGGFVLLIRCLLRSGRSWRSKDL